MKLWILKAIESTAPWQPPIDRCFGFVVEAPDEHTARELASSHSGEETTKHYDAWANPILSTCEELKPSGKARVILSDERFL